MILPRRSFLLGLGSLLAAPAIVHAGNLMPVRAFAPSTRDEILALMDLRMSNTARELYRQGGLYSLEFLLPSQIAA